MLILSFEVLSIDKDKCISRYVFDILSHQIFRSKIYNISYNQEHELEPRTKWRTFILRGHDPLKLEYSDF